MNSFVLKKLGLWRIDKDGGKVKRKRLSNHPPESDGMTLSRSSPGAKIKNILNMQYL
jgi:hypothetical protein